MTTNNATSTKPVSAELTRAEQEAGMLAYREEGAKRAEALGNRGPLRLDDDGKLHSDILAAYWKHGFYVFEGAIDAEEVSALQDDATMMLDRAPVHKGAKVDAEGRPALGLDHVRDAYVFVKPLSDPWGGTAHHSGRHPAQMSQPTPEAGAPADTVYLMRGMCQEMPSGLRLYGHPKLLAVAESINGADFTPFNDVIFVKQPGLGGSVAWHQDGVTHWEAANWDEGIHGFNFQVQLFPATVGNCLWVIPGSHKLGRVDIKGLVEVNGGSEQLPDAVPLICAAGDVTIVNRQAVHGSFANTSPDLRVSITFGFHRRTSVLGAKAALGLESDGGYDAQRIHERAAVIAVAIDARRQQFPDEQAFAYQPFVGMEAEYAYNAATFESVLRDYDTRDLAI